MSPVRFSALAAVCCAALLFSQTAPPPRNGTPAFGVTVNLVEVDALVTDSKGRHVPDLKPEDFTILEDGKPQKITQFTWVNPEPAPEGRMTAIPGAALATRVPRRGDVHRTIVLMIDNLHTHSDNIGVVAPALRNFVKEQVMPGDLVSVMGTQSGMGLYESFTSDRRQLEAAIEKALRITGNNRQQESTIGNGTPNPIMHDGMEEVYASGLMPLTIPAGMKEVPITGKLNLTDRFAPGEYAMQFIAHDKLAAIDRQTWMDFSISSR